ncbi:MAG: AarF/ABC1/UbiB kinase family protein [Planctomycetales bacterium]|nr:AarF/ABC1/UbiB kinase family protein [Planctomycetales bacterium]
MTNVNWNALIEEDALAGVLPGEYARFARPVHDGLMIFLAGLPQDVQHEIMAAQARLAPQATIAERLGELARCSPVLHKLGQILARDQRLSPQLRTHLQKLESLSPSTPLDEIRDTLTGELGPLDALGVTLVPPAIAEASVAVVIPYQQNNATSRGQRHADGHEGADRVFKVLKPHIERRLEIELGLLQHLGEHLDERCDELGIPHLDYAESFLQVKNKLWEEVRLDNEQRHLAQAAEFFAGDPDVQIPVLLEHCTSRVTAMSRIYGGKVTDHAIVCPSQRRRLAKLVARALIARPIFADNDQALFHCDPHAGNLFFTDDNRLAILDWSLVGRLNEHERSTIARVMLAAVTLDATQITSLLTGLAERQPPDAVALAAVVRSWLRRVRHGQPPTISWLTGMLDDAVQQARLSVGSDLMLFRKSLHTLEGVLVEIGSDQCVMDEVLGIEFLRALVGEWPKRWLSLPDARAPRTRLSNIDIARTMFSGPATLVRFWAGHAVDMIEAHQQTPLPDSPDTTTVGGTAGGDPANTNTTNTAEISLLSPEVPCPSSV